MAITYGQIKDATLQWIDEYSSRGAVQSLTKTADYNFKIQTGVNGSINNLASTVAKIAAEFPFIHNPIKSTSSDDTSEIKIHLPGDDYSISLINAQATFFEIGYPGVAVLEESADGGETYSTIETITVPSIVTGFTEYRRLISPSSPTNLVRLRFTGSYSYSFRNEILYDVTFVDEESVQQHRPVFIIDLPLNFLKPDAVYTMVGQQEIPYTKGSIKNGKFYYSGYETPKQFLIRYWRKPNLLTFTNVDATDRALEIDLTDEAALIIPQDVAGKILISEQQIASGTLLVNMHEVAKSQLIGDKKDDLQNEIQNISGW